MEKKSLAVTDRPTSSVIYKPSPPPIRAHLNPLPGAGPMPRFVCMILLLVATALTQDASTGAIRGSVFDSTGGRIHGACGARGDTGAGLRYGVITEFGGGLGLCFVAGRGGSGWAAGGGGSWTRG